jgi:Peptidase family M41/ATPase family associated with various cellular activities (AAA)/C-terminal, D2-small domain, of ClpB protein
MKKTPLVTFNKAQIAQRQRKLEKVRRELKQEFVGIDAIIDELITYIQIWYLMPEVLSRPVIVNLWGMTGVGKTDLVRKLVKKLDYQDRFAEVELSNSENSSYYSWRNSVAGMLESSGLNDGQPAIVLFDEIQRFNTLDAEGKPILNDRFQDFWELLSDGRLARRDTKEDISNYLDNYLYSSSQRRKQAAMPQGASGMAGMPGMDDAPQGPDNIGIWDARTLKKLFDFDESIHELAEMKQEDILKKMIARRKQKRIYEAADHSRTLIIISGNLDEAFSMARETSEADVDADIFHAYTKKLTLVDIKMALSRKFKPEQVARFGNIHLIYRSLRRRDFVKLIEMEVTKIKARNRQHFGVELELAPAIHTLVYQNGVFPVQGVRPVFSSITDVIEANLSRFMFQALMAESRRIKLDYDFAKKELIADIHKVGTVRLPYEGRVDRIRQGNDPAVTACVSVHESGHAVAYAVLFGLAPLQLKSKVASTYAGGFTFPHQIFMTKQTLSQKIKVMLAGGLAEELIFGDGNASIGREHDREQATYLACDYIRKYGFHADYQGYYSNNPSYPLDTELTDSAIEEMIRQLATETRDMLRHHQGFLLALSVDLQLRGSLAAAEIAKIAKRFGVKLAVKEESHLHVPDYALVGKP